MAAPVLMIGMMNCKFGDVEAGSVKSASVTVKPTYKEHQTGYPQITDLKALKYAEGICRVETEEDVLTPTVKAIAISFAKGLPKEYKFEGNAPGFGGVVLTISGTGFGSGASISGKMEDFGTVTCETTCMSLLFTGAGTAPTNGPAQIKFVEPKLAGQALTKDTDNLLYGSPTIDGSLCTQGQFQATCKVKYLAMSWPPTIDAAIMESTDFSATGQLSDAKSGLLSDVTANMASGVIAEIKSHTFLVPTIGAVDSKISFDSMVEPDLSFTPGNDWNGIAVKITAILKDPTKVGTNWCNIA